MEFEKDSYLVDNKNKVDDLPIINIIYPEKLVTSKMFPINIRVDEIDITTTSKSLLTNFVKCLAIYV